MFIFPVVVSYTDSMIIVSSDAPQNTHHTRCEYNPLMTPIHFPRIIHLTSSYPSPSS